MVYVKSLVKTSDHPAWLWLTTDKGAINPGTHLTIQGYPGTCTVLRVFEVLNTLDTPPQFDVGIVETILP